MLKRSKSIRPGAHIPSSQVASVRPGLTHHQAKTDARRLLGLELQWPLARLRVDGHPFQIGAPQVALRRMALRKSAPRQSLLTTRQFSRSHSVKSASRRRFTTRCFIDALVEHCFEVNA